MPTTFTPRAIASWIATVPTPPAAPAISNVVPSRTPSRSSALVAVSTLAAAPPACSQLSAVGFGAHAASTANSALAPPSRARSTTPNTSSPWCTPVTPSPTSSTTPAASTPGTCGNGNRSPNIPERRYVSPGVTPEARTAMRT